MLLYQDDPKKISQFFIKLLKPLPGWRLVSPENWLESLGKEYKKREINIDFPIPSTSSTILIIPLLQRLEILRNLCEFHLEQPEHFWELLKVKDEESKWRIEPIGKDSLNRRYWVFSDGRMYREIEGIELKNNNRNNKNKNNKKETKKFNSKNENGNGNENEILWDIEDENNWELVCLTRSDYDEFLNNFSTLKSLPLKDRSLSKIIKNEIIPKVEPILNFQLSQHKKYFKPVVSERICLLPRKRSSRLIEKEIEEMQRKEAEKLAEKERILQERSRSNLENEIEIGEHVINRDLSAEREFRAQMRRNKREREMQVKAIEEAFYQNYAVNNNNNDNNNTGTDNSDDTENESLESDINEEVEIISSSSSDEEEECINEFNNITTSYNYSDPVQLYSSLESAQKSPFKLLLKMKTSTPTVQTTETVSQNLNDVVDIIGNERKSDDDIDLITANKVEVEAQGKDVFDDNLVIIDECTETEESEHLEDSKPYIIPVSESTILQTHENENDIAQILLTKFSRPDSPNK